MHIDDIPRDSFFTFDIHTFEQKFIYIKLNESNFILYKDYNIFKDKAPHYLQVYTMNIYLLESKYAEYVTLVESIVV